MFRKRQLITATNKVEEFSKELEVLVLKHGVKIEFLSVVIGGKTYEWNK